MLAKPDLITVMEREGITPNRAGMVLCPFHGDKIPSLKTYTSSGRWKCFGCGAGGDAVDLVRLLHGLTYPEALRHLGIGTERTPDSIRAEREARATRERRRRYRENLRGLTNKLSDKLREMYRLKDAWREWDVTPATRDEWAEAVQEIPHIEYKLDVLLRGDEQEKLELYKEKMNGRKKV